MYFYPIDRYKKTVSIFGTVFDLQNARDRNRDTTCFQYYQQYVITRIWLLLSRKKLNTFTCTSTGVKVRHPNTRRKMNADIQRRLEEIRTQIACLEKEREELLRTEPVSIHRYIDKITGALYDIKYDWIDSDSEDDDSEDDDSEDGDSEDDDSEDGDSEGSGERGVLDEELNAKREILRANLQSIPTVETRDEEIDERRPGTWTAYTVRYKWAGEEIRYEIWKNPCGNFNVLCNSEEDEWCLDVRKLCKKLLGDEDLSVWPEERHLPILYEYFQNNLDRL
jgi:hypothetical protein